MQLLQDPNRQKLLTSARIMSIAREKEILYLIKKQPTLREFWILSGICMRLSTGFCSQPSVRRLTPGSWLLLPIGRKKTKPARHALEQDLTNLGGRKRTNWGSSDVAIGSGMDGLEEEEAKNSRSGDLRFGLRWLIWDGEGRSQVAHEPDLAKFQSQSPNTTSPYFFRRTVTHKHWLKSWLTK
jgi:hypothetical protein